MVVAIWLISPIVVLISPMAATQLPVAHRPDHRSPAGSRAGRRGGIAARPLF
jgi:hypothetical protein